MSGDRVRPTRVRAEQDRALSRYIRDEVYGYSAFYRSRLDAAGLGRHGIRRQEDLTRLPPMALAEVDPTTIVLRPDAEAVVRFGSWRRALTMRWARLTGQAGGLGRATLDPEFKPVRWTMAGGVPLGYAADDVDRLSELGRRTLELAGLRPDDVLVGLFDDASGPGFWQVAGGARAGGVASLFVPSGIAPEVVAALHPTVLAGGAAEIDGLLEAAAMARLRLPLLRTVVVVGGTEPLSASEGDRISGLAADAVGLLPIAEVRRDDVRPAVVSAYAPPGVRALWAQCRGGDGLHTWPATEVVEADGGELLWTGIGWRGSALLRLRTGVRGEVDGSPCPACGRTTPRVRLAPQRRDGASDRSEWPGAGASR